MVTGLNLPYVYVDQPELISARHVSVVVRLWCKERNLKGSRNIEAITAALLE